MKIAPLSTNKNREIFASILLEREVLREHFYQIEELEICFQLVLCLVSEL